jgi:uncharacterized membrane protein YkoI
MNTRIISVFAVVLFTGVVQLLASSLISKAQAEKDALAAVGGGTVIQAVLDTNMGRKTWSVDIAGTTHEYEVWVDAHTGAILKIITQPLAVGVPMISKAQAESDALAAVGEGTLLQAVLGTNTGTKTWSVDILGAAQEYEVRVDAHTSAILRIVTQPLAAMAPCKYISKSTAQKDALAAVLGGKVLSAVLEKTDNPPVWSVNVVNSKGSEYEVKVNACNGAIVTIIVGG